MRAIERSFETCGDYTAHCVTLNAIILYFKNSADGYNVHNVFITEDDRKAGKVTIPASVIRNNADKMQVWLIGENQYGRLKMRRDIQVTD